MNDDATTKAPAAPTSQPGLWRLVPPATWIVLAAALVALAGVVGGSVWFLREDRKELLQKFAEDRREQVKGAAKVIEDDLRAIRQAMLFAGQLARTSGSDTDRRRELEALVAVVPEFKSVSLFSADGEVLVAIEDPSAGVVNTPELLGTLKSVVARAFDGPAEVLVNTPPIPTGGGWYRVFALRAARGGDEPPVAVVMLVDTRPLFEKLRLVGPLEHLLLFGNHGRPTPVTDPALLAGLARVDQGDPGFPSLAALAGKMRSAEHASGSVWISDDEARRLGLGNDELIASYAKAQAGDASQSQGHWSIAMVASTSTLRGLERAIAVRVVGAAGLFCALLMGLAAVLIKGSMQAAAVAERLRQADALAHLHDKTEKILDNIPTAVLALSRDGKITTANRAFRDRIGKEILGRTLEAAFELTPQGSMERLTRLVEAARTQGRVQSLLGERIALFGEEGSFNLHAVPLEPRFEAVRLLLVIEDLSEVESLESQLLRAAKLATVGVLGAGIAHEVGTPLGVIRGRAEYVLGKLGASHPQANGLEVIIGQIDQVTRTIRQLLDFSRVRPAETTGVPVHSALSGVQELLRFEAERRKVALDVLIDGDLPPLLADPDQLQQVLVNLTMNALDASPEKTSVTLHAALEPEEQGGRVILSVKDQGHGISEEHQAQVFDPFFTTKKRGRGTGLGLTIAAQIVRNHGGAIELHSSLGKGTEVQVRWPKERKRTEAGDKERFDGAA